jgi:F420H(2)-dependent quinone reductase
MGPYTYARYLLSTRRLSLLTFRFHRAVYRLTGGRLLPNAGSRMPVLLLTTTGRKTGQQRTWPLNYLTDDASLVVVASNRGRPTYPQWYLNLRANPEARIQVGRRKLRVSSRVVAPDEAARLWPAIHRLEPLYSHYRKLTDRDFPLVILTPMAAQPTPAQ